MTDVLRSEDSPTYDAGGNLQSLFDQRAHEDAIIISALRILETRMRGHRSRTSITSPADTRAYLQLQLFGLEHEVFVCLWLDSQNRVIAYDEMFRGTLSQTSVYPREVAKRALQHNAAGVIFAHNHPSGVPLPSRSDEFLTKELKTVLAMFDVKVLDHFIVAGSGLISFAEKGLI